MREFTRDATARQVARRYNMSAQIMNRLLEEWGIQEKEGKHWVLRGPFKKKGYAHVVAVESRQTGEMVDILKWTPKGQSFLDLFLKARGIERAPQVEQNVVIEEDRLMTTQEIINEIAEKELFDSYVRSVEASVYVDRERDGELYRAFTSRSEDPKALEELCEAVMNHFRDDTLSELGVDPDAVEDVEPCNCHIEKNHVWVSQIVYCGFTIGSTPIAERLGLPGVSANV